MKSLFILSSIYLIKSIQGLTCDSSCFNLDLESVNYDASDYAYCYTYSVSLSSDASCTVDGTAKVLFGIDTNECYINTNDLASKITSTSPLTHSIKEDDTNGIIGLEFEITDNITFCIKGIVANQETTTAPLQFSDDTNQCTFSAPSMPNFCGICDGDFAQNSCFCFDTLNECEEESGRPRGDLACEWDADNTRCIASDALECTNLAEEFRPCVCFWTESECIMMQTEGNRDCDWDGRYDICSPSDCIADNLNCGCFELRQDCESNEIVDFPQECIWTDDDECIEMPVISTTMEEEEDTTTTEEECVDECGCFDNEIDCEFDRELGELQCVWMDECVEATPTAPPSAPPSGDMDTTATRMPTVSPTRRERTRAPSTSTTWSKPTSGWNKGWSKSGNKSKGGKNKSKGKKGGRP